MYDICFQKLKIYHFKTQVKNRINGDGFKLVVLQSDKNNLLGKQHFRRLKKISHHLKIEQNDKFFPCYFL